MQRLDEVVANRRKISAGDNLFNSGEPFRSLFAIRSGFFKNAY